MHSEIGSLHSFPHCLRCGQTESDLVCGPWLNIIFLESDGVQVL